MVPKSEAPREGSGRQIRVSRPWHAWKSVAVGDFGTWNPSKRTDLPAGEAG